MIINHKSHFSWWHEGAHMTVAARWGFKYYLMNQNTWSRPRPVERCSFYFSAEHLLLCWSGSSGGHALPQCLMWRWITHLPAYLHSEPDFKPQRLKKWDPSNQLWVLWLIGRKFFPVCVCGGNVAQWRGPSVWRGSEWLTGLSRFIIRVFLGCGWPLDLHPRSQTATTAVKKCETVCFQGKRGWHLNVTVAVSSYKRKPNVD